MITGCSAQDTVDDDEELPTVDPDIGASRDALKTDDEVVERYVDPLVIHHTCTYLSVVLWSGCCTKDYTLNMFCSFMYSNIWHM